ncbi:MAG: peptidase M10 [Ferruginibacter sp.]
MGEAELDKNSHVLNIHADLIFYGNAANELLAKQIAEDVAGHWNEPGSLISIQHEWYELKFDIKGYYAPALTDIEVYENIDPGKNYFRVEAYASGNISFVDGINCNTGYFKLDNLLNNSTTAAHEFGHTLGLDHPAVIDIRGKGVPGIMYPRGTIVDPPFQYDPAAIPGAQGGTMNPFTRKVLLTDIEALHLNDLSFDATGNAVLGDFSSVWHDAQTP